MPSWVSVCSFVIIRVNEDSFGLDLVFCSCFSSLLQVFLCPKEAGCVENISTLRILEFLGAFSCTKSGDVKYFVVKTQKSGI